MKLGIMQPYFLPYIGYFQLINAVDKYVIYDDVQYIKGGWINRNFILLNSERFLINLLLLGASSNKTINEIEVQSNQVKLKKTIESAYKKAPMFDKVFPVLTNIMEYEKKELGQFLGNSIKELCNYMSINTELIYSSKIEKDNTLKAQDKVMQICNILKADKYLNAIGGQALYNKDDFKKQNIELHFLNSSSKPYTQFNNEFVPYLSIVDVLMFNSVEKVKDILNDYNIL